MLDFITGFLFGIWSIASIVVVAALLGKGKPTTVARPEPKPDPANWWKDGGKPTWDSYTDDDDAE